MSKEERKRRQIERYLAQSEKARSHEEERALRQHSRARRAERGGSRRRRGVDDDSIEEAPSFEKLKRSAKLPGLTDAATRRKQAEAVVAGSHEAPRDADASGLVLSVGRALATVHLDDDGEVEAHLASGIARAQKSAIAVGDRVHLEALPEDGWRVLEVAPRRSRLSRPDPTTPALERVVAANVDVGVVVLAAAQPAPHLGLIDRMIVAMGDGGVKPVVCLNKVDLVDDATRTELDRELESYRRQGVPCLLASTETGEGVDALREALAGRLSVLLGPSGVGKSSLKNALAPDLERAVGSVREADGKGRHTTTASRLVAIGPETHLIDTPGIRAFGLWAIPSGQLEGYIAGVAAPGEACRFRDCIHDREPGCAVRAAVERGEFPASRHERYLRMRAEVEGEGSA